MSNSISVQAVSKCYRLGQMKHETMLREALTRIFTRPVPRHQRNDQEFWALKDISFDVRSGEVLGFIGANGAGKSTLLKILSKIVYPTSGRVRLNGRVASLLEVGTGFHSELTGRENIYLNGSILGMKKQEIDTKFDAIVDFSGVAQFVDTPLKHYSSGMALRLGFAVAAHLDTEILLVDEVLAVGDLEFQRKCLKSMEELHNSGRTVIFVSHNLRAVERLCSRVLWISKGEIKADGRAADIVASYVAAFAERTVTASSDFDQVTERGGGGEVRFTGLEILDAQRQPKENVQSGDALVFRLHYRANQTVRAPYFGLRLHSELGEKVSEVTTWNSGLDIPQLSPGRGTIEVTVHALNFSPGRYSLSLWLASHTQDFDVLNHCAVLEVKPSDFYGSGRGINRFLGTFLLPCTWSLNGRSEKLVDGEAEKGPTQNVQTVR